MNETILVSKGIPEFVKKHLKVGDGDYILWSLEEDNGEPFCKASRGHPNTTTAVETPKDEYMKAKKDFEPHMA